MCPAADEKVTAAEQKCPAFYLGLVSAEIHRFLIDKQGLEGKARTMELSFYENDPNLQYYFENLPINVKNRILESGMDISTLSKLEQAAEAVKADMTLTAGNTQG